MKKTGKNISLILLCCAWAFQSLGQDAVFSASVDKNPVAVGDIFSLKLTLENARGEITPPDLSDFKVVFGPSQSSSYRIVNGRQSSAITLTYSMRPIKTGTFTIGAAKANAGGKKLSTDPIEMKVVQGQSSAASNNQGQSRQSNTSANDENLKVMIQLSKSKAYLGEQVVATYILLTRYSNLEVEETNFPTMTGFWTEDLKNEQATWERQYEMVNGVAYRKAVLKSQILFPQRTGKLKVEPITLSCRVNRSFFNSGTELKIASNSPTIDVQPLPGTAPEGYSGAVGDFKFSVDLDKTDLQANEAVGLKITITGSGNLPLINEPNLKFPTDFEVYDPETKDRINTSAGGVNGSRVYQYLIIPRYPGEYEMPKIKFSYFNPRLGKYVSEEAGPYQFKITGEAGASALRDGGRSQSRVEQSANDIRYIVTNTDQLISNDKFFFGSVRYYAVLATPFLMFLIFVGFRKRKSALDEDVSGTKQRKANKMARRRLKAAEAAMKVNDSKLFYAEIFQAIYGYLGDKLNIPGSRLSRNTIAEALRQRQIDEKQITQLMQTLDTCEMARFAPITEQRDSDFYQNAVQLISDLDRNIK